MKVALIGVTGAGKTSFFSSIYHEYRSTSLPSSDASGGDTTYKPTAEDLKIGVRPVTTSLEKALTKVSNFLSKTPILDDDWPTGTVDLEEQQLEVTYYFRKLKRQFKRTFTFYDPPGGIFGGTYDDSLTDEFTNKIRECDAAIVFIPAERILDLLGNRDTIDRRTATSLRNKLGIGIIQDTLEKWGREGANLDGFPLTFALSQADEIPERQGACVMSFIHGVVIELTEALPNLIVCTTVISIINSVGNSKFYEPTNIEIPFAFSTAGAIFRQMLKLRKDADYDGYMHHLYSGWSSESHTKENELKKLHDEDPLSYFFGHHLWGKGFSKHKNEAALWDRCAEETLGKQREKSSLADDDLNLLRYLFSVIQHIIGPSEVNDSGVAVWRSGERKNPLDIINV